MSPVWVSNLFTSQYRKVRMLLSDFHLKLLIRLCKCVFPHSVPQTFYFQILYTNQTYTLFSKNIVFPTQAEYSYLSTELG